jgi:hypothetical protein
MGAPRFGWLLAFLAGGVLAASCGGDPGVTIPDSTDGGLFVDGSADTPDASPTCRPETCPGTDTECATRTCKDGACAMNATSAGTALRAQKSGDCRREECDGNGGVTSAVDDGDVPDDANPCTIEACKAGAVTSTRAAKGTTCGTALACDGEGACVGCTAASECPGVDTECQTRTCIATKCGVSNAAAGKVVSAQVAGDCKKSQCDGAGKVQAVTDDTDLPNDAKQCTSDVCTAGVASNPPLAAGTACNEGGSSVCNGAGGCVQCVNATTCPGADTACRTRTCNANTCGASFAAAGTKTPTQTAGDCQANQCDGAGNIVSVADNADVPVDNNQCTADTCAAGAPANPPLAAGAPCNQGGGAVCSGGGMCVQCTSAAQCPGVDSECRTRTCIANTCGVSFAPAGTPTAAQTPGDCKVNQCNGAGAAVSAPSAADVPADDGAQCTSEVCIGSAPSHVPVPAGTPCNQNGATQCDGAGQCAIP